MYVALLPYNMSNATKKEIKSQVSQFRLVHSKLRSITPLATKVQVILCSFAVVTCMSDTIELVWHVTLIWILNSFSSHLY